MDTDTTPPPNNGSVDLIHLLTQEQVKLLKKLLMEVIDETGYGDVKIIIAEKRVVRMKAEKSY